MFYNQSTAKGKTKCIPTREKMKLNEPGRLKLGRQKPCASRKSIVVTVLGVHGCEVEEGWGWGDQPHGILPQQPSFPLLMIYNNGLRGLYD